MKRMLCFQPTEYICCILRQILSHCAVSEFIIHTHPMESHWKFLGGGGVLKAKFLEAMYENKPEFPGGEGVQNKNLLWGEY